MIDDDRSLIDAVLHKIPLHLRRRPILAAFSGGLDSTVLLHLLCRLREEGELFSLTALHVHHGLQPQAEYWVDHALAIGRQLEVPVLIERVEVGHGKEGLEAAARTARYAALARHMEEGGVLMTAHHRDDQAETFLLQLLRGAGVRGLASMPAVAPFAGGWHVRPLLEVDRDTLHAYALAHGLRWITDPSNADPSHARNLVRHQIFPLLHTHWPQAEATLARAARRMAVTEELLGDLGRLDLASARSDRPEQLEATALMHLSDQRLFNAVRTWLIELGLPLPPQARLAEIRRMLNARADALPILRWRGGEIRRWRARLYAYPAQRPNIQAPTPRAWDPHAALECPELGLRIIPQRTIGHGLRLDAIPPSGLHIRLRQGGETIQVVGQPHRKSLKKLLQAASIPPWERERIPLFFIGEQLAQVGDQWIDAAFAAGLDEPGLHIRLQRLRPEHA